jgi:hypothetical protein
LLGVSVGFYFRLPNAKFATNYLVWGWRPGASPVALSRVMRVLAAGTGGAELPYPQQKVADLYCFAGTAGTAVVGLHMWQ